MKCYVRAPYPDQQLEELKGMFDEVVYEPWTDTGLRYYEDEMLEHLQKEKPQVLITELDKVTEKVLKGYPDLKVIGDCRATPANLEVDECTKAGVPILTTVGRNTLAVAEMATGLMICALRKVIPAVDWVREGGWVEGTTPYFLWMGNELTGKKVGIVGFGAIGKALAKCLSGFDVEISFYDPYIPDSIGEYKKKSLEAIFEESDVVTLHLPVTPETTKLVGMDLLKRMKKSALFVNLARSAIVDYDALIEVMDKQLIAGAVIDVLDEEPPTEEAIRIGKCPNVLLTPHIAGATYEVTDHQAEIMNARMKDFLAGQNMEKIVYNKDVLNK